MCKYLYCRLFFLVYKALIVINHLDFGLLPTKKPDLKNAFDVFDLYASDPNKQQELDEDLQLFFFTKIYKLSNFKL